MKGRLYCRMLLYWLLCRVSQVRVYGGRRVDEALDTAQDGVGKE
jgi:hypothetical protein